MFRELHRRRAVIALGGNAIARPGEEGTVEQDYASLERSLDSVVSLLERGYELVLTHGNGPQVGNQMIRVELARDEAPLLPLDVIGADIQGGLGYMLERVLRGKLRRRGMAHRVCCLLCMVEVDAADPAFADPTKFVGPPYRADQVDALQEERGWVMKEDQGRGWRRVVASPEPKDVIERQEILTLAESGAVVISGGGGGIPVARTPTGDLVGVECVIDKDLASAVMALALGAPELIILTGVERVMLHYGTPRAKPLNIVSVEEARGYLAEGHFPAGSMGPKMEAACRFVEGGGSRTLITDVFKLPQALEGKTGTWVTA
ncbi:MAG TPA: carbamate kinase [Thermoanaerobaculia bacterium]|nr:carbamate kinase [Thermoanaerobaculia bacterium]